MKERAAVRTPVSALALLVLLVPPACSPSPRDVVPESHDVRTTPQVGGEAYVHVARRAHGTVALAESRYIKDADARAMTEKIADDLERCAIGLEAQHLLVEGAARIVAIAGPDGTPALNVRLAPGDAVAQNALLCLVAPVRATTLPAPTSAGTPGFAIEATWGPPRARSTVPGSPADPGSLPAKAPSQDGGGL